jgi:predicted phage-related endonuclease
MNITITNRVTHSCVQGSPEWHALRAQFLTASEAPAMMGVHKQASRTELLRMKKTGIAREVTEWVQRFLFDKGHDAEAAARPIVEGVIGDDLYPVTMTAEVNGLPLLASMDGLTMLGDTGWETKLLNQDLRADVEAGTLHEHYTVQMEQQLMVSGAVQIYFTTTDGTPENTFGMWYESNPALRERIVAGWQQFAEDVAAYVPESEPVKPVGVAPEALPALRIEVTGMVTASNLAAFREHALAVFGGINTDLQTDADFADAERTVKWCKEVEDRLDAAKQHALSQTASIDDLFRTIDAIKEEARQKRLTLDKLVKAEKENRKAEIVAKAQRELSAHIAALQGRIGVLVSVGCNFGEAVKGLKSLDSMRDKASTALAHAKIEANAVADRIDANRKLVEDMSLMPDFAAVCTKATDDFAALYGMRKQQRADAEAKRLEAEREKIRREEEAKARAEAERIAQAERDRIRAEEQAKAREAAEAERARLRAEAEAREQAMQADAAKRAAELRAPADVKPEPPPQFAQPQADTGAKITLGQINQRLSPIALSVAGLAQLGIQPAGKERAAVLYLESDVARICSVLIRHLTTVARGEIKEAA